MNEHPNDALVKVRWDTYQALRRIREDASYPTFDQVIRKALQKEYPHFASDL